MKFNLNILILIVVNISIVWSKCDLTIEDADKCGLHTQIFGNRDVVLPTTDAELTGHCSALQTNLMCFKTFINQCLTGSAKQTTELMINNGAKHLGRRCDNPKDRQEFLTHIKCIIPKEKIEPFHVCSDKNMVMMEKVLTMGADEALGGGCCAFHMFQNCIRNANKENCGEATTDYWDEVINEITDDSISFSCVGFETLEKCHKNLSPNVLTQLKAVDDITDAKTLAQQHSHRSGMSIMIDVLKKWSS